MQFQSNLRILEHRQVLEFAENLLCLAYDGSGEILCDSDTEEFKAVDPICCSSVYGEGV